MRKHVRILLIQGSVKSFGKLSVTSIVRSCRGKSLGRITNRPLHGVVGDSYCARAFMVDLDIDDVLYFVTSFFIGQILGA